MAFAEREMGGEWLVEVCQAICDRIASVKPPPRRRASRSGRAEEGSPALRAGEPVLPCPLMPEDIAANLLGAGITYIAAKINHLFLHLNPPYLEPGEIAHFYQTPISEMIRIGDRIMKDYSIQYFDPAFSIFSLERVTQQKGPYDVQQSIEKYYDNLFICADVFRPNEWIVPNELRGRMDPSSIYTYTLSAYKIGCKLVAKEAWKREVGLDFDSVWTLVPEVVLRVHGEQFSSMQTLFLARNLFITFKTFSEAVDIPSRIAMMRLDPAFLFMELWSLSFVVIGCTEITDYMNTLNALQRKYEWFENQVRTIEESIRQESTFSLSTKGNGNSRA